MSVFDIMTEEFVAELPDDPQVAFGMVLRRAENYVSDAVTNVNEDGSSDWHTYETAQYTAMNTIIAAAKQYKIKPFESMSLPRRNDFSTEDYSDFKVDLDHYSVQLMIDNHTRANRQSIEIDFTTKDRLRQHVHAIKCLIDKADIPEARRALLHKRIADFEATLEKPRVNLMILAGGMVSILAVTANISQLSDSQTMSRLVATIMSTIGEAKAIDAQNRDPALDHPHPPLQLPPPDTYALKPNESGNLLPRSPGDP